MSRLFAILSLIFAASQLHAASADAAFLTTETSARPIATGGAYAAADASLDCLQYNPAGLASLPHLSAAASHLENFADWTHDWFSVGVPLGPVCVAGEFMYSRVKAFEIFDENGDSAGEVGASSQIYGLAVAGSLVPKTLSLGLGARGFTSTLADYHSRGWCVSLGALCTPFPAPLSLGVSLQNLGQQTAYIQEADPLPTLLRAGLAWQAVALDGLGLQTRLDYVNFNDPSMPDQVRAGLEAVLLNHLSLAAGFQGDEDGWRYSLGAGFEASFFRVSYAYLPHAVFTAAQRVSLEVFSVPNLF